MPALKLCEIKNGPPSYVCHRASAILDRQLQSEGLGRINHKRIYRDMKEKKLLAHAKWFVNLHKLPRIIE
jgi:hypothetical protein